MGLDLVLEMADLDGLERAISNLSVPEKVTCIR